MARDTQRYGALRSRAGGIKLPLGKHLMHPCVDRGGLSVPLHDGLLTAGRVAIPARMTYRFGGRWHPVTDLCRLGDAGVSVGPSESASDIRYLLGFPDSFPTIQSFTTTFSV